MVYYRSESFSTDTSIGYLIRRIHQLGAALLEPIFEEEGLTGSQWSAMISIFVGEANTCGALAREVGHDKGAMTRLVDQLEARGFIERERDATDRRIVNLTLTDEGRATGLRVKEKVLERWNQWLADMDKGEIDHFLARLQGLKRKLDQLTVAGDAE
jgi:DNA-binding MarR family transcriptional regulator